MCPSQNICEGVDLTGVVSKEGLVSRPDGQQQTHLNGCFRTIADEGISEEPRKSFVGVSGTGQDGFNGHDSPRKSIC